MSIYIDLFSLFLVFSYLVLYILIAVCQCPQRENKMNIKDIIRWVKKCNCLLIKVFPSSSTLNFDSFESIFSHYGRSAVNQNRLN